MLTGAAADLVPLAGGKGVVVIQCIAVRVAGDGALQGRHRSINHSYIAGETAVHVLM